MVLIDWALPPEEAEWTNVLIERATSESGPWTQIKSQVASDNTYYDEAGGTNNYYRIRFYNSDTGSHSSYSSAMLVVEVTTYYCQADDVARILQVDEFGGEGATAPSLDDIEEMILEVQDWIDGKTHNSWRSKSVSNEIHDINQLSYERGVGWPIYLKYRNIKTLSSSDGDKIEIWDGESWVDWIASSDYSEGRDEDYWVDQKTGILYIVNMVYSFLRKGIRLTYRYGNSTVPKDIRRATALKVAIDVLRSNDRTIVVPDGSTLAVSYGSRIRGWKEEIDEILSNHAEVQFPLTD